MLCFTCTTLSLSQPPWLRYHLPTNKKREVGGKREATLWGREEEKELERCEVVKLKEADTYLHTTHTHRVLSAKNACNKKLKDRDIFSINTQIINVTIQCWQKMMSGVGLIVTK